MPHYKNNWLMAQDNIPRPEIVRDAHLRLLHALREVANVTVVPFPQEFDTQERYIHDFIFVRDSFLFVGDNTVIISNYSEHGRKHEAQFMERYLSRKGYRIYTLSPDAYAEGGEFYVLHNERVLFAGLNRNSIQGVREVVRLSGIDAVCIVRTSAFHLDTNFSVLLGDDGQCVGVIAVLSAIKNAREVAAFCRTRRIPVIEIDPTDGMGDPQSPGSLAANSLALPGVLVGCSHFTTNGVEEAIADLGIRHIVVPLYDLKFSGGSVHCLTNELAV